MAWSAAGRMSKSWSTRKRGSPRGLSGPPTKGHSAWNPGSSTAGKPCATLRPPARQPPKGRPGQGTRRGLGQRLGQRLKSALGCWNGRQFTVLLEVASPLEAATAIEEEAAAALEAKRLDRPGLTTFTDGSRLENEATGME